MDNKSPRKFFDVFSIISLASFIFLVVISVSYESVEGVLFTISLIGLFIAGLFWIAMFFIVLSHYSRLHSPTIRETWLSKSSWKHVIWIATLLIFPPFVFVFYFVKYRRYLSSNKKNVFNV